MDGSYTRPKGGDPAPADDDRVVTPFRFSLERLRALRERSEDLAKQELAGALVRRTACAARLEAMGEQLDGVFVAQREATLVAASAHDLRARQAYLERLELAHEAGEQDLGRHELEVAQRRDAVREAARDRQALERLKERRRTDHARALARAEGATLDEIALAQHRRSIA
jgi:flagellar FliJ protein